MNIKKRIKKRTAFKVRLNSGLTDSEIEKVINDFTIKWTDHCEKHYSKVIPRQTRG